MNEKPRVPLRRPKRRPVARNALSSQTPKAAAAAPTADGEPPGSRGAHGRKAAAPTAAVVKRAADGPEPLRVLLGPRKRKGPSAQAGADGAHDDNGAHGSAHDSARRTGSDSDTDYAYWDMDSVGAHGSPHDSAHDGAHDSGAHGSAHGGAHGSARATTASTTTTFINDVLW